MKTIFKYKEVERFFNALTPLNRSCINYYPNQDCAKTVFARRLFKGFYPYWMIELEEETGFYESEGWDVQEIKLPIIRFICIAYIGYYLGDGDEIEVWYFMAGSHKMQTMKIDFNTAYKLKGRKITKERYYKIDSLFKVKTKEIEKKP